MKKTTFTLIVMFVTVFLYAQTDGTLTVTTTTSQTGGKYQPKNIVAIWIQDNTGKFVKTLLAYADKRKKYLTSWADVTTLAGSSYNTVDAVTGATRNSHDVRTCSWNGKNFTNSQVVDGVYTVKMELTDLDGTGRSANFSFTKGPDVQTLTPANAPSFSNITITWQPVSSAISDDISPQVIIYPNPAKSKAYVSGRGIRSIEVFDIKGNRILKTNSHEIDLTGYPAGIYIAGIFTQKGKFVKRIVKE